MNERIQKLREESVSTQPVISMERAIIETDVYKKYQGQVSVPVLRALFFKELMENKELYIGDGELIVGEKGEHPQAAPTFPELCCHSLEDMRVMDQRDLISFKVKDEYFDIQEKTILPFWENRSTRSKILSLMTDEWKDAYGAGIFTEFMEQRGPGIQSVRTIFMPEASMTGLPRSMMNWPIWIMPRIWKLLIRLSS